MFKMFKWIIYISILVGILALPLIPATALLGVQEDIYISESEVKIAEHIALVRPSAPAKRIARAIHEASTKCSIQPYLIAALMEVESSYKADAESETGARGLMQIIHSTATSLGLPWELAYDIELNTEKGACYLARHLDTYKGRIDLAAKRYNGNDDPLFAKKVLTKYAVLSKDTKYTVVVTRGDTLADLAQLYLGDAGLYPVIAIQNNIPDPDKIEVGQVLVI